MGKKFRKKSRQQFIDELVEKYKKYCCTYESFAVLFVKKYLIASDGKWIDIVDCDVDFNDNVGNLEFKNVTCELFKKKILPKYPPKQIFESDEDYILTCRAITWQTAHEDINTQRAQNIQGPKYSLSGKDCGEPQYFYKYELYNVKRLKD